MNICHCPPKMAARFRVILLPVPVKENEAKKLSAGTYTYYLIDSGRKT